MQDILEQILSEVKDLKRTTNERFDKQAEEVNRKFIEQSKEFNKLKEYVDKRFIEQSKEVDRKFIEQSKEVDKKFDKQSKEISEELRSILEYICNRYDNKIDNVDEKLEQEIEINKVAHEGYNSKIYKLELSEANLETKVYDLEKVKRQKVAT